MIDLHFAESFKSGGIDVAILVERCRYRGSVTRQLANVASWMKHGDLTR
jgi:hypothetical protein